MANPWASGAWAGGSLWPLTSNGATVTLASGQLKLPDGTAGAPSLVGTNYLTTGLYWGAGPKLFLGTNGAATPELTLSGGNVGIGTSPSVGLDVRVPGAVYAGTGNTLFVLKNTTTNDSNFVFDSPLNKQVSIILKNNGTSKWALLNDGTGTVTGNSDAFVFYDTAARLSILQGGNVGIGTTNPSTPLHVVGTITATAGAGAGTTTNIGVASIQTSAAGVGNGADATDDTLFTYSLPLNSLSANGKSVRVRAWGKTAANANGKTIKPWFAGTAVLTSGSIAISNLDWSCEMEITRIDATHVSVIATYEDGGFANGVTTVTANLLVADLTANASIIKVTGASAASAANDVLGHGMKVWFEN